MYREFTVGGIMHLLPMYYFKVVVKNRSINKAAQELHITQQTLSAHMNSV